MCTRRYNRDEDVSGKRDRTDIVGKRKDKRDTLEDPKRDRLNRQRPRHEEPKYYNMTLPTK